MRTGSRIVLLAFLAASGINNANAAAECRILANDAMDFWQQVSPFAGPMPAETALGWRTFTPQERGCDAAGTCIPVRDSVFNLGKKVWIAPLVRSSGNDVLWFSLSREDGRNRVDLTVCVIYRDGDWTEIVQTEMESSLEQVLQQFSLAEEAALAVVVVDARTFLRDMDFSFYVEGGTGLLTGTQREAVVAAESLDNLPQCTTAQTAEWQFVNDDLYGAYGWNPGNEYIGTAAAKKKSFANWFPVNGYRQTLCGEVSDFVYYKSGKERDLNHFIIPDPKFDYILELPKELVRSGWGAGYYFDLAIEPDNSHPDMIRGIPEWWDCRAPDDCVEVEITPPDTDDTPYPHFNTETSSLKGRKMCVHGPWVTEASHNARPEIHPAELMWWRDRAMRRMAVIQDGSERFGASNSFTPRSQVIQPWAKAPLTGEFWVTVSASADDPQTWYIEDDGRVNAGSGWDVAPDKNYTLGGSPVMAFRDEVRNNSVTTALVNACRDGSTVRGYLSVKASVGKGTDAGDAGAWYLTVRQRQGITAPPPDSPGSRQQMLTAAPKELEGRVFNELYRFAEGTIERRNNTLQARLLDPADSSRAITVPLFEAPTEDVYRQTGFRRLGILPEMIVSTRGDRISDAMRERLEQRDPLQGRTPTPDINRPQVAPGPGPFNRASSDLWRDVAESMQLSNGGQSLALHPVGDVTVNVQPGYAAMRGGSLIRGDDSVVAEALNEKIRSADRQTVRSLFGEDSPFHPTWSFSATNVVTGATIVVASTGFGDSGGSSGLTGLQPRQINRPSISDTVRDRDAQREAASRDLGNVRRPATFGQNAANSPVTVTAIPNNSDPGRILGATVKFASDGNVYELKATVTVRDSYDNSTTVSGTIWSHDLRGHREELEVVAADTAPDDIGIRPPSAPVTDGSVAIRRSMEFRTEVRQQSKALVVARVLEDGRLDIGELKAIASLR